MLKSTISFPDFVKLDLRVGTIKIAEPVEGSERLMKMQVDLGPEIGERQIIAGIALWYTPADLIDRQVVVVVNLESKKMMGMESAGMIMAAGDEEAVLLQPSKGLPAGTIVR